MMKVNISSEKNSNKSAKVFFCQNCVMSNQRPGSTIEFKNTVKADKALIGFNKEGICNACEYKLIKDNDIVLLAAFGSGFAWGSTLIKW